MKNINTNDWLFFSLNLILLMTGFYLVTVGYFSIANITTKIGIMIIFISLFFGKYFVDQLKQR
jgi:uncharacterized membrane protein